MSTHPKSLIPRAAALASCLSLVPMAHAAWTPPQVAALDALRAASATPVEVRYRHGFPSSVRADVAASGSTAVERARNFLDSYADFYLMSHPGVELVHSRSDSHPVYGETVRFAQRFEELPVFGAEIVVRLGADGAGTPRVLGTTGLLFVPARTDRLSPEPIPLDTVPAILPGTAEDAARAHVGAPTAPVAGETVQMIHDPGMAGGPRDPRLAWRVTLIAGEISQILVDANTGEILLQHGLVPAGPGLSDFDLDLEDANGGTMQSTNCFNPTTIDDEIGDEDGIDSAYLNDVEAVNAWFHSRSTYLTFHDTFGRHSHDDDDGELEVYVHSGAANAAATGSCGIEFSDGWMSLDIMGHEFAHMVNDSEANLLYFGESGALEEAFADLMGAMVDPSDWLIGEDRTSGLGAIRNLVNPPSLACPPWPSCPDRWSLFVTTLMDNGGVHTNSHIISKAFTLISDGGTFNGVTVNGMGRTKMGHLAYRAFTTVGWQTQFLEFRDAAIMWAVTFDILNAHGFTSQDACTVRNAFAAVELGSPDSDCDGVEDNVDDSDGDGILDNGDGTGGNTNFPCPDGVTTQCDDNCRLVPNPGQADWDGDGSGDACDTDSDNDGIPDGQDHCPGIPGTTGDTDSDGLPDCLDPDDDEDGILDDGDASGVEGDFPCPSNVTSGCDDNCIHDPNPSQFDGNANGMGDACDPDLDGDGQYGGLSDDDNCPFTYNPSQADSDGDGLGDACDDCPNTADHQGAWHQGYPELGVDPFPLQKDSDGDGIPDACDSSGWASASASTDGAFYHWGNALRPSGARAGMEISGAEGSILRLPFRACDTGQPGGPGAGERVEMVFEGLAPSVSGWVENGSGEVRGRIRPHHADSAKRGLRLRPRCHEEHYLVLRLEPGFPGAAAFDVTVESRLVSGDNPWTSNDSLFPVEPPPPPPDQDGDGIWDGADTCPQVEDPANADADRDGTGDACDAAPGGRVTAVFAGTVSSVDDGLQPAAFSGIAPGTPFTGRMTWDTTMRLLADDYPEARSYIQPAPIEPLELLVEVAGRIYAAGPDAGLEILVVNGGSSGEDRLEAGSTDVAGESRAVESLSLILEDGSGAVFPLPSLPAALDLRDFSRRVLRVVLGSGPSGPMSTMEMEITMLSEPYQEPQLYWVDSATHTINRSSLDGSGVTTIVQATDPVGLEVDTDGGWIYWTECCSGRVRRSALDGSGAVTLATGLGFPFGIGLDAPGGALVFADVAWPGQISTVGVGGGAASTLLSVTPGTPYGLAVDDAGGKVYWTEFGSTSYIRRMNLDGTGVENLVDSSTDPLDQSRGIALDPNAGKMYWTDLVLDRVSRSNLDGTGPELVADFASAGIQDPTGIAVDPHRGKVYWSDTTLDVIQRSNLDGSMVETILTAADGLSFPRDLHLEPGTACQPPSDPLTMDMAETAGGPGVTLHMTDTNGPGEVTGYNIYRSPDASLARPSWPLIALDAPDEDPFTAGIQWTDSAAGPPAGGAWYYTAVAYNSACPLEGPQ